MATLLTFVVLKQQTKAKKAAYYLYKTCVLDAVGRNAHWYGDETLQQLHINANPVFPGGRHNVES